jgi:hypothetical protein
VAFNTIEPDADSVLGSTGRSVPIFTTLLKHLVSDSPRGIKAKRINRHRTAVAKCKTFTKEEKVKTDYKH